MTKITVIIPTLNEESNIKRVLDSVSFADEIIVIDSFSNDDTIAIANTFSKVKIIQRKFDDFSAQKNYAIGKANNDWVLNLDADEELSTHLQKEIKKIDLEKGKFVAYTICRKFFFKGKRLFFSGFQRSKVIRLFNKTKCYYRGKVHEQVVFDGDLGNLKNKINHYSYHSFEHYKGKLALYAKLQAKELREKQQQVTFFHLYIKPVYRFLSHYIIRLGFLDLKNGFVISYLHAYGVYLRYKELIKLNSK